MYHLCIIRSTSLIEIPSIHDLECGPILVSRGEEINVLICKLYVEMEEKERCTMDRSRRM